MTRLLFLLTFLLGAGVVGWIGLGFRESDPIALTVTLLIGAVYGFGFLELMHFRRTTGQLDTGLNTLPQTREQLGDWIARLPPSLQNAVRRRVEGAPIALPGPMLTPYLTGLLVMLGLLGTFVGMIVTLDGAATALNGSSELSAIRSALAAPIQGLSLAFGTSIAGVAASAMLGLAATLSRRDRTVVSRTLENKVRQELHHLSLNHQREQAFTALQTQSQTLPELVTAMQAMTSRLEQMSEQLTGTLTRNQDDFHTAVSAQYQQLAESVAQSLQDTLRDSSRLAAEGLTPIMEQAMAQLGEQAGHTHQQLTDITERQLSTLAQQFQHTTEQAATHWQQGLAEQNQASQAFADDIRQALQTHNADFRDGAQQVLEQLANTQQQLTEQTGKQLADINQQFSATTERAASSWHNGLSEHQKVSAELAKEVGESLKSHREEIRDEARQMLEHAGEVHQQLTDRTGEQLAQLSNEFRATTEQAANSWHHGLAEHQKSSADLVRDISASLTSHNESFQTTTQSLLNGQQHGLEALTEAIRQQLGNLNDEERRRGEAAVQRLAELEATVASHLTQLGTALEAPMTRLIETASETPKAAADVITQLRQEMARNAERDNELLSERHRIMSELDALLNSQRDAAAAQREAIETLIRSTSETLSGVSDTFSAQVSEQNARLADVADEVTGSAQEVASLSDAFSLAVTLFTESNDKLLASLTQVERSLEASATRSDEQLAYYVEQAREVIELSMTSQKDVIDALGALRGQPAAVTS
ncbi:DUF802 domain-containing protein [Marinobacter zhejiangensis]|uniref:DUF802 domain-containing protein n=1 Tax=Marinobacter zhejiangensis TaxID=488535 RepID=A0A1I4SZK2_9GAMM|nr:DUF802 domain-containing protein [Marinobacter zhejiangensis]SFM69948.1 protein of unknown function [Marinobacter zhejiangensis]